MTLIPEGLRTRKASELAIEALARETALPLDRARQLYEEAYARLARDARIQPYLPVLAAREARATAKAARRAAR